MLHLCVIAVGLVQTCSAVGYSGYAPVEQDGRVRDCHVVLGTVYTCALPHTGPAVLPREGKLVSCNVDHGFVVRCSATGFNGDAVVLRP